MKKIYTILILGLFIAFNPLVAKFSYAGLTDVFKSDLEFCMDKVYEDFDMAYAASLCAGASSGVKSCMKKVYEDFDWAYAAKVCTGK
tara:strand:- start:63 stop:323 length:261 start_codon:yes stop_codon:yes gene_type:complete